MCSRAPSFVRTAMTISILLLPGISISFAQSEDRYPQPNPIQRGSSRDTSGDYDSSREGYAQKVNQYRIDCEKNEAQRIHGFDCVNYAAYKACIETESTMGRDFRGGGVEVQSGPMSFSRRNYVSTVPPNCLPQYDSLQQSILQAARRQRASIEWSACDFDKVLSRIDSLNYVLGFHPDALREFENELAQQKTSLEEIGRVREQAQDNKRQFKSGTAKANAGLVKLKGAFARCERHEVVFSEAEQKILRECAADLINSVFSWNSQTAERFHQFKREENTAAARMAERRADIRECKAAAAISISDLSLITECGSPVEVEVSRVNADITAMNEQITLAEAAVKGGEWSLAKCSGLAQAKSSAADARAGAMLESYRCPIRDTLQSIMLRIDNQTSAYKDLGRRIGGLLGSAENSLRYCEWSQLSHIRSDAQQLLPDSACWEEFPIFSKQNSTIQDLAQREQSRFQEVAWRKDRILQLLPQLNRAAEAGVPAEENLTALRQLVQSSRSEGYHACMLELIAKADAALAAQPDSDTAASDWGFSADDSTNEAIDPADSANQHAAALPSSKPDPHCDTIRKQFYAALQQRDAARGAALLEQGQLCPFAAHGRRALQTIAQSDFPARPARIPAAPLPIDCTALARDFNAAMSQRDYKLAGRLTAHLQSAGCQDPSVYTDTRPVAEQAQQAQVCAQYEYQIQTAVQERNQNAISNLLAAASAAGCHLGTQTLEAANTVNRRAQIRQNRALSNTLMNLGNALSGLASAQSRHNAPPASPQSRPQAQVPDMSGRSPAVSPVGGEMIQPTVAEPPQGAGSGLVSEGDKESRRQRVQNLHQNWYRIRCDAMYSGCAVEPDGARDGLLHSIDSAATSADLQSVDRKIACIDGCFSSTQGQDYSILLGCTGGCN